MKYIVFIQLSDGNCYEENVDAESSRDAVVEVLCRVLPRSSSTDPYLIETIEVGEAQ